MLFLHNKLNLLISIVLHRGTVCSTLPWFNVLYLLDDLNDSKILDIYGNHIVEKKLQRLFNRIRSVVLSSYCKNEFGPYLTSGQANPSKRNQPIVFLCIRWWLEYFDNFFIFHKFSFSKYPAKFNWISFKPQYLIISRSQFHLPI